jgi:tetratricopeptide (TPR) repeat protein
MMLSYLTDAIVACEQTLDNPLEFAVACRHLGHLLQGMARFEEAVNWQTWATEAQPNRAQIHTSLGHLYREQRCWQQAGAAYQTALKLNPDDAEAYWGLAQLLSQQGKTAAAVAYWNRAVTLDPQKANAEGYLNLGNALLEQGKTQQAIDRYLEALRRDPHFAAAYNNLAEALLLQERWQQAIECYHRAIEQLPEPAWAYYKLGNLLLKLRQYAEAAAALRHSIALNPNYAWAYHNLVEALQRLAQWDEAIIVTQALLALNRDVPWAYTHLGRAYGAKAQWDEAIVCYQQACKLRGWHQCLEKGYQFTQDWFTHNIPLWEAQLQPLANTAVCFLEIGSFQGMSACWLLDRILTHPDATLACIDPNFQPEFALNLAKTQSVEKVTPIVGNSHDCLPLLASEAYDVIYIDGCHLASHVQQDALLSWRSLKPGGLLIFDDYEWTDPAYPGQDPKLGIDAFLDAHQHQLEVLHRAYQVIVKKRL